MKTTPVRSPLQFGCYFPNTPAPHGRPAFRYGQERGDSVLSGEHFLLVRRGFWFGVKADSTTEWLGCGDLNARDAREIQESLLPEEIWIVIPEEAIRQLRPRLLLTGPAESARAHSQLTQDELVRHTIVALTKSIYWCGQTVDERTRLPLSSRLFNQLLSERLLASVVNAPV